MSGVGASPAASASWRSPATLGLRAARRGDEPARGPWREALAGRIVIPELRAGHADLVHRPGACSRTARRPALGRPQKYRALRGERPVLGYEQVAGARGGAWPGRGAVRLPGGAGLGAGGLLHLRHRLPPRPARLPRLGGGRLRRLRRRRRRAGGDLALRPGPRGRPAPAGAAGRPRPQRAGGAAGRYGPLRACWRSRRGVPAPA